MPVKKFHAMREGGVSSRPPLVVSRSSWVGIR
jgi:hypothetical protein